MNLTLDDCIMLVKLVTLASIMMTILVHLLGMSAERSAVGIGTALLFDFTITSGRVFDFMFGFTLYIVTVAIIISLTLRIIKRVDIRMYNIITGIAKGNSIVDLVRGNYTNIEDKEEK